MREITNKLRQFGMEFWRAGNKYHMPTTKFAMSYTGTLLNQWCSEERGRAAELCRATGIHGPSLSKLRSGEKEPTYEVVSRILREWEEPWATELVIAWLKDQTPEEGRDKVQIAPAIRSTQTIPARTDDVSAAFEVVVEEARHNHFLQRIIVNLAGFTMRMANSGARGAAAPNAAQPEMPLPGA